MDINMVLQKLWELTNKKPEKLGSGTYQAKCPCHNDKEASLSVTPKDGKVLIHCHAGCDYKTIIQKLDLPKTKEKKEIEKTYDYVDSKGKLVYQVVRFKPKNFMIRVPDGNGGWKWSIKGVKKILYNLPEIKKAIANNKFVFLVEGEKDADNLINLGLPATTNPLGANKWTIDFTNSLKDARVVIVPDNDTPGKEHSKLISSKIKNIARETRILNLPGLDDKEDISDWLCKEGNTIEELKTLSLNAPVLTDSNPPDDPPDLTELNRTNFAYTDLGNSERFNAQHHNYVLFNHDRGKWYVWNGKVWEIDANKKAERFAKETVRSIYAELDEATSSDHRKAIARHAMASENVARISALLSLSKSIPGISSTNDIFDQHDHLINFNNGIYDLLENKFLEHDKRYNITKICPVDYDLKAKCPEWDKFLNRIFDEDKSLIEFVQKAIGISLSGFTDEQILLFAYGIGANGKSTFFETIRLLLGEYAQKAPTEMLLARTYDGGTISNDQARLKGARFVVAAELPSGKRLNEQVIKDLTGGDTIAARFLHQEFFEFKPTHKLWIYGNHKPIIRDTDDGIWRRVCLVPFKIQIPKKEQIPQREILQKFANELSGILNWAIKGWQLYNKNGLNKPESISEATNTYRSDSDVIGSFITECCVIDPSARAILKDLYEEYDMWAQEGREFILKKREFIKNMMERGFEKQQGAGNKTFMHGVGLLEKPKEKQDIFGK